MVARDRRYAGARHHTEGTARGLRADREVLDARATDRAVRRSAPGDASQCASRSSPSRSRALYSVPTLYRSSKRICARRCRGGGACPRAKTWRNDRARGRLVLDPFGEALAALVEVGGGKGGGAERREASSRASGRICMAGRQAEAGACPWCRRPWRGRAASSEAWSLPRTTAAPSRCAARNAAVSSARSPGGVAAEHLLEGAEVSAGGRARRVGMGRPFQPASRRASRPARAHPTRGFTRASARHHDWRTRSSVVESGAAS